MKDNIEFFADQSLNFEVSIIKHKGTSSMLRKDCRLDGSECLLELDQSNWVINYHTSLTNETLDMQLKFQLVKGTLEDANVALNLNISDWSAENFVLMPAAVYNGNRFEARSMGYPPQFSDVKDMIPDISTVITDVPRLNTHDGLSRIQLLSGDMSTPAVGWYCPASGKGLWLLTEQSTVWGDSGIALEEFKDRSSAVITISAPGVRPDCRYTICSTKHPSEDRGASFKEGDSADIHVRLYTFKCRNIQELFDYFTDIRKSMTGEVKLHHQITFSAAWEIQEAKYNKQNWQDTYGYYTVGLNDSLNDDWQTGWVGGLMVTHALLSEGMETSRTRALCNLDFVFNGGQDASGFFFGCGHKGKWYGDNFHDPERKWHLIRKSSDALYFLIKQFMLLKKEKEFEIPEKWLAGTRKCADAFVRLWNKYGQFGQFVDTETGDIIVGGSVSGGIAPAGLALAAEFFGDSRYLKVAKQAADYYYINYVQKGITTGGPGEILQCPDSESAFALLESFVILYEVTGEYEWIEKAKDMANQCFTWVVSYD